MDVRHKRQVSYMTFVMYFVEVTRYACHCSFSQKNIVVKVNVAIGLNIDAKIIQQSMNHGSVVTDGEKGSGKANRFLLLKRYYSNPASYNSHKKRSERFFFISYSTKVHHIEKRWSGKRIVPLSPFLCF